MRMRAWRVGLLVAAVPALAGGCVLAAAGAGAGGAVYVSDRGAESVVNATVDKTQQAARETFRELGIKETKASTEQAGSGQKLGLWGESDDREITVWMETQGNSTKVDVVAQKSRVTWDKDLAKQILERIVALSK
jgi:hypothetical protein